VGTLYLVRHGQASFGADDYDNLSELGAQQAQMLGQWFYRAGIRPTHLVVGGMRRHQQTCRGWAEGFQSLGGVMPLPAQQRIDPRWNEYDHEDIFGQGTQAFGLTGGQNKAMERREFQKLFEKTITRWISGEYDAQYREPWKIFEKRCQEALKEVQLLRSGTAVVFSSGGAIGATVAHILGLSAKQAMQFNYLIANCSVSRAVFRDDEISLATFNNFALFETQAEFLTYR
jgi:broad specificity phosphatase PhoE